MKRNLLIVVFAVFCSANIFADNYLTVTNIPDATAGESLSVGIQYTSESDRGLIYSIYSSTSDGVTVDWSKQWAWINNEVTITAGTDAEATISINIPPRLNSDDLDENINYLLVLEFDDYSVGTFDGNILSVAETTTPYTWAELTSTPPASIAPGEATTLNYRYRVESDAKFCLKVALSVYNGDTYVSDEIGHWVENFNGQPLEGYIDDSYELSIPADFRLSSELQEGQRYVIEVAVSGENWAWIGISTKYDITISAATGIENKKNEELNLYPNPVQDMLTIKGADLGETVMIYSASGSLIKTKTITNSLTQVGVADLAKGIYFIKTSNSTVKFIKN
nr:T9SS type A sorting domain-containing protein [uncultured Carboxylicivirga sp.]